MIERAKEILQTEITALQNLPLNEDDLKTAVEWITSCQGKVVISGMGKCGKVADKIAATMSSLGTPAVFMQPSEAAHGDLGLIDDKDIVIFISNSGKTKEILLALKLCRAAFNCKIIGITSKKESKIAQFCDLILEIGVIKEACSFGLAPTSSTTAVMVLGDILSILVMEKKNFTLERYGQLHHSGYLNKRIKEKIDEK